MQNKNQNLTAHLVVPVEMIERRIYLIRGQKVMLDSDLAELYQVPTKVLNQAVKRNKDRFPDDFMFRFSRKEAENLNRSQFVTGSQKYRDPRLLPYAFTEHGVAMISSVLKSKRAVQVNIFIIRAFIKLREVLTTHKDLEQKIEELERKQKNQSFDIKVIFKVIKSMLKKPVGSEGKIGFRVG